MRLDAILATRLREEIREHERAIDRIVADVLAITAGAECESASLLHVRALGSALQDFYSAVEDIFEKIAPALNGGVPQSGDWHARLLHSMTLDLPGVRPPVIDIETELALRPLLRFRHRARNIYGYELDWAKLKSNAQLVHDVAAKFKVCLADFYLFLDALAAKLE